MDEGSLGRLEAGRAGYADRSRPAPAKCSIYSFPAVVGVISNNKASVALYARAAGKAAAALEDFFAVRRFSTMHEALAWLND